MKDNKIDIIFIASIWPETFSYTTEEVMMMGLPVASFDIGAPAERIRKYDKGLVVSEMTAETALNEIIKFVGK
jgi:glycosyltransferase involved in cell wall biosynthesis